VAVVGAPSAEFGEEVVAFVVSSEPIDGEELRDYCSIRLAPYKVPRIFRFLQDVPRTSVGKIDKQALKRGFAS